MNYTPPSPDPLDAVPAHLRFAALLGLLEHGQPRPPFAGALETDPRRRKFERERTNAIYEGMLRAKQDVEIARAQLRQDAASS